MILTDHDCGFCQRTAALVPRLGFKVDVRTLQAELPMPGVDSDLALVEMAYMGPDGDVRYGARAWAAILRTGAWPWRVVAAVMDSRPVAPVAARVYRWISANRDRMPGGTPACRLEDRSN